jgi:hypothetical protein
MNARFSAARRLFCLVLFACTAQADAATYDKEFYADAVKAGAKILAGGVQDTWSGSPRNFDLTILEGSPPIKCKVCDQMTDNTTKIGPRPGLPIALVPGKTVNDNNGFDLATVGTGGHADLHDKKNDGQTRYDVFTQEQGPKQIKVTPPAGGNPVDKELNNYVHVRLTGEAIAGALDDNHRCHAADAASGVMIEGVKTAFQVVQPGDIPVVKGAGRVFSGGAFQFGVPQPNGRLDKSNHDPYFATLVDLDTGDTFTEIVMQHTVEAVNGSWQIDDSGIRLAVGLNDPESFVELSFDQPSTWVLNPYSYGAHLDMNGLIATGALATGWTVSTLSDRVEAFFPFGPDGMPFDSFEAAPPFSLFQAGHSYTYNIGDGDGIYEQILGVPEPANIFLAAIGALMIVLIRWRREGQKHFAH